MILNEILEEDSFNSVEKEGTAILKEKGSKFLGFCYEVNSIEEVNEKMEKLRSEFHDARHFCFAYRINPDKPELRYSDDGEPKNAAGIPIFNQLRSAELWNALVVVVRYFGGTKLGVSGLVNAYKQAASEAIAHSKIAITYLTERIHLRFPYTQMNEVMRLVKECHAELLEERMREDAGYLISVRRSLSKDFKDRIAKNHLWSIA